MLLIELLRNELKEWPVQASHVVSDAEGVLHFTRGGFPVHDKSDKILPWTVLGECDENVYWWGADLKLSTVPSDYKTSVVSREEWEKG